MDRKVLRIKEQNEITTYLTYSLPLCSLLWDNKKYSWIYEHFTNFYLMKDNQNYIWLDYLEDLNFPKDVMEYNFYNIDKMKKEVDIIEFIKNNINQEYTLSIFVDLFFLRDSSAYNIDHIAAQGFIYGYNDNSKEFYGIGFRKNDTFGEIVYHYDDILKGYQSCLDIYVKSEIWVNWYNCVLMKVKEPKEFYKYDASLFIRDLTNFLNSEGSINMLRPEIRYERGEKALYGIKAQEELISAFNELKEGLFVLDYRCIHLLCEHKRLMYKKMIYTSQTMGIFDDLKELLIKYEVISKKYKIIKNEYIKYVLIDNNMQNLYGCLKNKNAIEDISKKLTYYTNIEKEILSSFLDKMS